MIPTSTQHTLRFFRKDDSVNAMTQTATSKITKAASTQIYHTIRFLADRERVEDAYRAYGYFRWVDDLLDSNSGSPSARRGFLERQQSLLEKCYQAQTLRGTNIQENVLVELVRHAHEKNSNLQNLRLAFLFKPLVNHYRNRSVYFDEPRLKSAFTFQFAPGFSNAAVSR